MRLVSNCCFAPVIQKEKDFYSGGIRFEYRCSQCNKICDAIEVKDKQIDFGKLKKISDEAKDYKELHGEDGNPIHKALDLMLGKIEELQEWQFNEDAEFDDFTYEPRKKGLKEKQTEFRKEVFEILSEK